MTTFAPPATTLQSNTVGNQREPMTSDHASGWAPHAAGQLTPAVLTAMTVLTGAVSGTVGGVMAAVSCTVESTLTVVTTFTVFAAVAVNELNDHAQRRTQVHPLPPLGNATAARHAVATAIRGLLIGSAGLAGAVAATWLSEVTLDRTTVSVRASWLVAFWALEAIARFGSKVVSRRGTPLVSVLLDRCLSAQVPDEAWDTEFGHYRLSDGTEAGIVVWLDDNPDTASHLAG